MFTRHMAHIILWVTFMVCGTAVAAPAAAPVRADRIKVDAQTEATIQGALKWLSKHQRVAKKSVDGREIETGHWGASAEESRYPVAMTGYTLMAFLAAGNLPGEGPHGRQVALGTEYLLDAINPNTGIYGNEAYGQYMYGHGIATIALAEVYGQTRNPKMRPKLQSVVERIVACQNNQGGWRYRPVNHDADISVTVLQVVALRAAKNGGIDVPQKTIDNAVRYVKACHHPSTGGFCYQPGSSPGFARTAAAIYSLQVCGLYDDEMVQRGSRYLITNFHESQEWFVYGNFYAAPAQYMQGGETWEKWYTLLKKSLLTSVKREQDLCSWDLSGRGGVGPVFSTAVFSMILSMPYHYIPLYQR